MSDEKNNAVKDEDYECVVQTAVDNALTYAEDRINHFKLFDDGEMTDVRRGLELSLNEVANVSWRAMFENSDCVYPDTVDEAIEIAEKDACDHVDGFIEERLDTSVKDGDYDEVPDVETMALAAYFKKFGEHTSAPSEPTVVYEGGKDYVVLENIYGILAVYEVVDDETVVWSDYLPEGYSADDDMRDAEG